MELAVIALAALLGLREWLHARERSDLLNRIQAPERVILEATRAESHLDDDLLSSGPWVIPEEAMNDGTRQAL